MLERHADVNSNVSFTPLVEAINLGYADMAEYLIDKGAFVNVSDQYNGAPENIPIVTAIHHGQLEILKILVENGANVAGVEYYGKNILEYAENSGSENVYNYLKSIINNGESSSEYGHVLGDT